MAAGVWARQWRLDDLGEEPLNSGAGTHCSIRVDDHIHIA